MSDEVQAIEPKSLNLFQKLWEKIPATWPHFFWSLLWAFLLAHPIALLFSFLYENLVCRDKLFSSELCIVVQIYWIFLPLLYPLLNVYKMLLKSFSLQTLLKGGFAILLITIIGIATFFSSVSFTFMISMALAQ